MAGVKGLEEEIMPKNVCLRSLETSVLLKRRKNTYDYGQSVSWDQQTRKTSAEVSPPRKYAADLLYL